MRSSTGRAENITNSERFEDNVARGPQKRSFFVAIPREDKKRIQHRLTDANFLLFQRNGRSQRRRTRAVHSRTRREFHGLRIAGNGFLGPVQSLGDDRVITATGSCRSIWQETKDRQRKEQPLHPISFASQPLAHLMPH